MTDDIDKQIAELEQQLAAQGITIIYDCGVDDDWRAGYLRALRWAVAGADHAANEGSR